MWHNIKNKLSIIENFIKKYALKSYFSYGKAKSSIGLFLLAIIIVVAYVKLVIEAESLVSSVQLSDKYLFENTACKNIMNGDNRTLETYRNNSAVLITSKPINFYIHLDTKEYLCRLFKQEYPFTTNYSFISDVELDFPIAFAFAIYKDIDRFARLFRIMYRPHNLYIIHVDKKSPKEFKRAVEGIKNCLGGKNIHILTGDYQTEVRWSYFSSLLCYLNSMKYLIENDIKAFNNNGSADWKYFINLSGMEFPLRTNYEIVLILKELNDKNHIELDRSKTWRWRFPHITAELKGLKFYKGFAYVMVTKEFCRFAVQDKMAAKVLDALHSFDTNASVPARKFPDEVFFQTLYLNPYLGTPGGCHLNTSMSPKEISSLYRRMYSVWNTKNCHSNRIWNGVCIFGVDDLPYLIKATSYIIADKFHSDVQPTAYDCLEVILRQRALSQHRNAKNPLNVLVDLRPYQKSYCLCNV